MSRASISVVATSWMELLTKVVESYATVATSPFGNCDWISGSAALMP